MVGRAWRSGLTLTASAQAPRGSYTGIAVVTHMPVTLEGLRPSAALSGAFTAIDVIHYPEKWV